MREEHLSDSVRLPAHRVCAREVIAWANRANAQGANLGSEQIGELLRALESAVRDDRARVDSAPARETWLQRNYPR